MPPTKRVLWLVAAAPIFMALGVARLLVLALPPAIVSTPLFLAHGFYQLLAFAALVAAAAAWSTDAADGAARWRAAGRRALAGCALAGVGGVLARGPYVRALLWGAGELRGLAPHTLVALVAPGDVQGALSILPVYQMCLFFALAYVTGLGGSWRRLGLGACVIVASQLLLLAGLGELARHGHGIQVPVLLIRVWAVVLPPICVATMWASAWASRSRRRASDARTDAVYREFWHGVGRLPDLGGAASTRYYADNERRLFRALPAARRAALLKTDLWDEAKNTRILAWAAARRARAPSASTSPSRSAHTGAGARSTRDRCARGRRRRARAAVRRRELRRDLLDGHDRALRRNRARRRRDGARAQARRARHRRRAEPPRSVSPAAARDACSRRSGLYGYGYEKSYSRRALREMLERAGLRRRRRNGDPLHPRLAADARPRVPLVVPRPHRRDRPPGRAVRVARPQVPVARPARILASVAQRPVAGPRG